MKKKKKVLSQTGLKRKYEKVVKHFVLRRDGYKCQVAGINHTCSGPLIADHWKSRGNGAVFFDLRNLTCICNNANNRKRFDAYLANAVTEVVKSREGPTTLEVLNFLSKKPKKWTEEEILSLIETYKKLDL